MICSFTADDRQRLLAEFSRLFDKEGAGSGHRRIPCRIVSICLKRTVGRSETRL
jgi:hypothetical protein